MLRGRDEGELQRRCVNVAGGGGARGVDRGRAVAQGNDRHGPLVHPVGADERGHRRVGVSAVERRGEPRGLGDGEELAEHRSCIPVHVPVSALSVAPAGAPRDPGDDERRRIAARRRSDLHDRVVLRVVPVHARRHSHALRNGDVHLQGETTARGPGGAEQPGRVRSLRRADDPGRQMQQAGELGQIQPRAGDVRGAGEHGDRRSRGGRQVPRKGQSWQRLAVPLVEPREAIQVVGLEALDHARVVDRRRPDVRSIREAAIDRREPCSVCVAVSTAPILAHGVWGPSRPERSASCRDRPVFKVTAPQCVRSSDTSGRSEVLTRGFRSSPHAPKHTAGKAPVGACVDAWDEDDHRNRRPQRLQVAALRGAGRGVRSPRRRARRSCRRPP